VVLDVEHVVNARALYVHAECRGLVARLKPKAIEFALRLRPATVGLKDLLEIAGER
jgi:hypothetical protein